MSQFEYECAITGALERGSQSDDSDKLDDLPVGWTKITIARRQYNPKWVLIQQTKDSMVEGLLAQFPADISEIHRYSVTLQIEAQFHSLEQATPMYARDVDDTVYISDAGEIADTINEIRDTLGLEAIGDAEDDADEVPEDAADESHLPHDGEVGD